MAQIKKLSVEKALNKLRQADRPGTRSEQTDDAIEALDDDIQRMKETRLRLERHQARSRQRPPPKR